MHVAPHMCKTITLKAKMLRKSLLENACDTKYVQNHYFADKCSGNRYCKMLLMPNMYENDYFEGKCSGNHNFKMLLMPNTYKIITLNGKC